MEWMWRENCLKREARAKRNGAGPVVRSWNVAAIIAALCAALLGVPNARGGQATFGGEHIISVTAEGARSVVAADLDGDGDIDIISASVFDDTVAWYENDGAQFPTFTAHIVTTSADGVRSVVTCDLDGDGDIDIVAASENDDRISWYENDGRPSPFFRPRTITSNALGARTVFAADLDGDGDIDILFGTHKDIGGVIGIGRDHVDWFENDGLRPPMFERHVVTTELSVPMSVHAADLNGDGDIEILAASVLDDTVAWFESDGASPPSFEIRVLTTGDTSLAPGAQFVVATDIDSDGDLDVLSAAFLAPNLSWFENDGQISPSFAPHAISSSEAGAKAVFSADLDNDGDIDVLVASELDDRIAWYENDGASFPSFHSHTISGSADAARSVFAADLDGDGDLDVISASAGDSKIAWYDNLTFDVRLGTRNWQRYR